MIWLKLQLSELFLLFLSHFFFCPSLTILPLFVLPINAIMLGILIKKSMHYSPYDIMIIIREKGYHKIYVASINPFFKRAYISRLCLFVKWDNRVFDFYFNELSSRTQIIEFLVNSFMTGLLFSGKCKVVILRLA